MAKAVIIKRVALLLISALGFGMLSNIPAKATVTSHSISIDAATDAINTGDSATAVLTHNFVNLGGVDDSVSITAVVTSSNASTAGVLMFSVTDSFTSVANDATTANSPRYTFGNSRYMDSVSLAAAVGGAGAPDTSTFANGKRGTDFIRVRDAHQTFLTTNFAGGTTPSARDSITIVAPGSDSTTVGTANLNLGSTIQLKLYGVQAAGTYTVSVFTQVSNNGAAFVSATPAVTWTVTATTPSVLAGAESTATLRLGSGNSSTAPFTGTVEGGDSGVTTARVSTASTTNLAPQAEIFVIQKNTAGTNGANNARESFTVTVSGEAYVSASSSVTTRLNANTGVKSLVFAAAAAGTATPVYLYSTGTAGTATVTITTASGQAIGGTKTLTFVGPVTALVLSRETVRYLPAGTSDAVTTFRVKANDANGNGVTGLTVTTTSSNTAAVASGGSCSAVSAVTSPGTYSCSLTPVITSTSGMTSTITARVLDPADTTSTTYLTYSYGIVTMGGGVNTVTLAFDKATYEPGEKMRITATAKDSSGNTPYDGALSLTLTANKAIGGTITLNTMYDGVSDTRVRSLPVRTYLADENLFAPAASGKFTVTGTFTNAAAVSTLVTGTATVGDDATLNAVNAASDAAAEAIDAANAATDAANLAAEAADAATVAAEEARDAADAATAAVEALATEVATLMAALKAQITTLANTVAKIAKKVKA